MKRRSTIETLLNLLPCPAQGSFARRVPVPWIQANANFDTKVFALTQGNSSFAR
jgi:hypothetical protein